MISIEFICLFIHDAHTAGFENWTFQGPGNIHLTGPTDPSESGRYDNFWGQFRVKYVEVWISIRRLAAPQGGSQSSYK